jgi:hypothetical protein
LPLFDKHPLKGSKLVAYNIFKTVVWMIKEKKKTSDIGRNY